MSIFGAPAAGAPEFDASNQLEGSNEPVILSEAKDHLATLDPLKMILRSAQDDSLVLHATMTMLVISTLGMTICMVLRAGVRRVATFPAA